MKFDEKEAYEEGKKDYDRGVHIKDCPYGYRPRLDTDRSRCANAWTSGWKDQHTSSPRKFYYIGRWETCGVEKLTERVTLYGDLYSDELGTSLWSFNMEEAINIANQLRIERIESLKKKKVDIEEKINNLSLLTFCETCGKPFSEYFAEKICKECYEKTRVDRLDP